VAVLSTRLMPRSAILKITAREPRVGPGTVQRVRAAMR
jgi:hypothetical protein